MVCEPAEVKLTPRSDYDAKFSLPFVVGASATKRRFSLADLLPDALVDSDNLAVASKVRYEVDTNSTFPKHFCGEVVMRTTDGRELRHRESVNRGADERPLTKSDIEEKFLDNVELVTTRAVAQRVLESVLGLAEAKDAAEAVDTWRGQDD